MVFAAAVTFPTLQRYRQARPGLLPEHRQELGETENHESQISTCPAPQTGPACSPECSKVIPRSHNRQKNRLAWFSRLLSPSPPSSGTCTAAKGARDCIPNIARSWVRPKITKVIYDSQNVYRTGSLGFLTKKVQNCTWGYKTSLGCRER